MLLTAGICWFLAALGVFVRDLAQINGYLLTIWFFLTPICYPEAKLTALPSVARSGVLTKNPILRAGARLPRHPAGIESARLDGARLAYRRFSDRWCSCCGHAWFYKLRKSFADLI